MIKSYEDLDVYRKSFELAMDIFKESLRWPSHERYGLTSQIRGSSRSVPGNIAEGWAKRKHARVFKRHLIDSHGSITETKVWLDFANQCGYTSRKSWNGFKDRADEIGRMIFSLERRWE